MTPSFLSGIPHNMTWLKLLDVHSQIISTSKGTALILLEHADLLFIPFIRAYSISTFNTCFGLSGLVLQPCIVLYLNTYKAALVGWTVQRPLYSLTSINQLTSSTLAGVPSPTVANLKLLNYMPHPCTLRALRTILLGSWWCIMVLFIGQFHIYC